MNPYQLHHINTYHRLTQQQELLCQVSIHIKLMDIILIQGQQIGVYQLGCFRGVSGVSDVSGGFQGCFRGVSEGCFTRVQVFQGCIGCFTLC